MSSTIPLMNQMAFARLLTNQSLPLKIPSAINANSNRVFNCGVSVSAEGGR